MYKSIGILTLFLYFQSINASYLGQYDDTTISFMDETPDYLLGTPENKLEDITAALEQTIETQTTTLTSILESKTTPKTILKQSTVIVWEKCGIESKTQITKIFEFKHQYKYGHQLSVFYNPIINAILFETLELTSHTNSNTSILTLNENIDTLFFIFNEQGRIIVMSDCHSLTKIKLEFLFNNLLNYNYLINTYNNVIIYESLETAQKEFKCREIIIIKPGTLLSLNSITNKTKTLLFTFIHESIKFSVSITNKHKLNIWSSNSNIQTIIFNEKLLEINNNNLYIKFDKNIVKFFNKCPSEHHNNEIAQWNTNIFKNLTKIETTKHNLIGSALNSNLIKLFCTFDKPNNLISNGDNNEICIHVNDFNLIKKSNNLLNIYLPDQNYFNKIDLFNKLSMINIGSWLQLSSPKIIIASRYYAKPRFFQRSLNEYLNGFTDGALNFWIGLNTLNYVTKTQKFGLRIEIEASNGNLYVEEYNSFEIGDSNEKYKLKLSGAKPGLTSDFLYHNNAEFSTYDYNRDQIARQFIGGFWFTTNSVFTSPFVSYSYYCFSCDHRLDKNGSTTYYYRNSIFSHVTRMILLL